MRRRFAPIAVALLLAAPLHAATPVEEIAADAAPAPDYANPAMWSQAASALPSGAAPAATDIPAATAVDVFYVHPTTFRSATRWTQDPADPEANRWTDESAIARQGSAFSGAGRVYAPRYRAASYRALMDVPHREAAFALAYGDVERAFDWFLRNVSKGRPFILAGHSQGAAHLASLVEKRIDGTPLQRRMVAAYIIGINLAEGEFGPRFKTVQPCLDPAQTGCIAQWNSVATGASLDPMIAAFQKTFTDKYGNLPGKQTLCINPVTFDARRPASLSAASKGAVPGDPGLGTMAPLVPGRVAVSCQNGLAVTAYDPALALKPLPGGSLHYHDVGLFWADVRANAVLRSAAWRVAEAARVKRSEADLRRRYALPNSRFVNVAGQPLHYVDEGRGSPIVLVHGSLDSLRSWDVWAAALSRRHRVIRFDRPFSGLSGPSPDGRVDGPAEARLIGQLADHFKLGRFAIVGTSSSGEGVAHFAATHPDRVSALILANIAAYPFKPDPARLPAAFKAVSAADAKLGGWHMPALWRGVLEMNYADPAKVTPALVDRWTDLNNRLQGVPRAPRPDGKPFFADTPADLAAIRAPTLLLWSDRDPETPVESHGRDALRMLGSTDKSLVVISGCGHMMPHECGAPSVAAASAFLARVQPD